jgi:subtilisin family serine protease
MPNVLLIKLRTDVTPEQAFSFSHDIGLFGLKHDSGTPIGRTKFRRHWIRKNSPKTAYELRDRYLSPPWNRIVEQVLFSYLPMLSALATTIPRDAKYRPDPPRYDGQWNMWRIQAGFNPSALCVNHPGFGSGWDYTRGSDSVVIWMIDVGWDYQHPDLRFFSEGMDFRPLPETGISDPPRDISTLDPAFWPSDLQHGTWCAGVLAASIDSSGTPCDTQAGGRGVAGVAGGCKIFPLVVQDPPQDYELAEAIAYAHHHMTVSSEATARILSISMGKSWTSAGYPEGWYNYGLIEQALNDALSDDMIICAASGNSANIPGLTSIWYPASKNGVLACGASDQADFRAQGDRWGSCYGPELSVVAPGVSIPTTDPGSDYISTFGQTSAAVPHVAGLAALLLSYKPCLTAKDVKDTIERTANRVNMDTYSYQTRSNGLWNTQVGYGRINVRQALESVRSRCSLLPIGERPETAERDIP